ncbi:MFS-type transporter SLC18B1-like isoform X2 [Limulus polyphemus]|nr:MFS-type transporter SLC18B1-like isoform X2 [Limulus polyphemus]
MVFGAYSVSQVIFSVISGKFLTKIGCKFIIVSGLFLTGGATVLFGCLEKSPGGKVFLILSILIRMVEGAGFAAYLTSVLAVVVKTFPENPGYYVGLTETIITVGMIAGPPAGSFLYLLGGYHTPFVVFGTLIMLTASASVWTVNTSSDNQSREKPSALTVQEYLHILKLPATILSILCVTLNVVADAFILITLSDHLQQFSLHPLEVGCVYLCLFISYAFSSPIAGRLADKLKLEYILQCVGSLVLVVSFMLIGPVAFLPLSPKVWLVTVGLLLKGFGAGPLISCSYSACLRSARQKGGLPENFRTYSLVSSIVSFSIPLGNLIGGFTAGVMLEELGMSWSTTIHAFVFASLAVACLFVHFFDKLILPTKEKDPTEHTPLYISILDEKIRNGKPTSQLNCHDKELDYQNFDELSNDATQQTANELLETLLKSQGVY